MYIHVFVDPSDGPNPDCLLVSCVILDCNVTFIKVTWDLVDCVPLYLLNISDIDSITTRENAYQSLYSGSATNISVSLLAAGGSILLHSEECIGLSIPTSTTLTTITPTSTTILTTTVPIPTTSTRAPIPTTILGWFSVIGSLHVHAYVHNK